MPIIIKLQDIDEAIENLHYKNETTLKSRLLRAVRQYYQDDASAESLQSIDAEELVKTIWETGDDRDLLKTRRKNFSSLKSGVNTDLKKLYAEGKNPQGIVIGHDNIFSISGEAKDKALTGIMDVFKEKGIETQSKISEILSAVNDILSTATSDTEVENTKEEIDRLKNILGGISDKLGLSLQDIVRRAGAGAGDGAQISGSDATPLDLPGKDEDLPGFIRGGLSMIDKGLQGLTREIEEASGDVAQMSVKESVRTALVDIVRALGDSGTDASGKAKKIMAAVEGMVADAIDASGSELSGGQAGQLKKIFHEMTEGAGEAPPTEGRPEADTMATPVQITGGELLAEVTSILGDGGLSAGDHPNPEGRTFGWQDKISKIMAAVNEMIGDALANRETGLSDEEISGIKEMIGNITGNLEALAQEALTEMEIVEEIALPPEEMVLPPEGETVEWVEEPIREGSETFGNTVIAEADAGAAGDENAELIETDQAAPDGLEEILAESAITGTQSAADAVEIEAIEKFEEHDFIEEIIKDTGEAAPGVQITLADEDIDSDLREKADLLTRLAEAAGALTALGPDLSGSVYTEEEIRGKAKFLSEEFDRYLSIRDKFYNAHILIKGGDYLVGGAHLAKSELEEQIATLPDFYIGKFPVTNALFEIFVEQTGYVTTAERYGYGLVYFPRMQRSRDPITGVERFALHNQAYSKKVPGACWHRPAGPDSSLYLKRKHPVVQVSLADAHAFAVWTGKRLPSEIEWEAAARTVQGLLYPWGNDWRESACNIETSLHGDTTSVDQYAKFTNSAGVADMLGNVLEWTSDVIGDKETSDTYIVKGASWISRDEISLTDRHYIEKNTASNILGFRCVAI